MKNYYTTAEVAKHFGVAHSCVRNWVQTGLLPREEINPRLHLIPAKAVEKFVPPQRGRPKKVKRK